MALYKTVAGGADVISGAVANYNDGNDNVRQNYTVTSGTPISVTFANSVAMFVNVKNFSTLTTAPYGCQMVGMKDGTVSALIVTAENVPQDISNYDYVLIRNGTTQASVTMNYTFTT